MNNQESAINKARMVVIEKLAVFRDDPTDERLTELDEAIEGWHGVVAEAVD